MTSSRSKDLAIFALAFSVAAHIALMWYMRPRIMAQVSPPSHHARSRGPMRMGERAKEAEMVHIDVMKDLEALKDSPDPETGAPLAMASGFDASEIAPAASAPVMDIAAFAVPVPAAEAAPEFSERFTIQEGVDPAITPIAPVSMEGLRQTAAKSMEETPAEAFAETMKQDLADVPLPEFEAPALPDAAKDGNLAESLASLTRTAADGKTSDFIPETSVMPTVDEKMVEAEKAAVRDLLDVSRASDLETFVTLTSKSARKGEWVYFKVQFDPGAELAVVPKDVVVLLDASGSIGNDRLKSCREAARKILRSCTNSGDRFNLVAFRDKFSYAFKEWQECSSDSFSRADKWLDRLAAHGRTDVFATIRSVLTLPRDPERPLIAMVVTDGDANAGVSATAQILSKFTALNDGLVSVYMYGVKESANRELLDVLTHGNRGESFIFGGPRWNAGSALEALAERFRDPVLSDLRVVFASDSEAEIYPQRLRNLYRGESVSLIGRAKAGTREVSFSVKGLNGQKPYEGFFTVALDGNATDESLGEEWQKELQIDKKLR